MRFLKSFTLLFLITISGAEFCFSQYKTIQSGDMDLYYRIFGQGDPILILGGGPGDNSNRYLSLCELLSKDFQCILVDQRGTGKSIPTVYDSTTISLSLTLSDFEALRQDLNLEDWSVLGFSYGGYLASIYANECPSSVSHLILLESIGLNTDLFEYFPDNIESRLQPAEKEVFEFWNDSVRISKDPHHALVERIKPI